MEHAPPAHATATTPRGGWLLEHSGHALEHGWHLLDASLAAGLPTTGAGASAGALLPDSLHEPVVLTRDERGTERLLSNVCTHRAALLHDGAGPCKGLRCPYHGRRFTLSGHMTAAPGFANQPDFPRHSDHLPALGLGRLGPLRFGSLRPLVPLSALLGPVRERIGWLPLDQLREAPSLHRDYDVAAHWPLYNDNYLEGLHIPFVHPGLNASLDMGAYTDLVLPWGTVQVGVANPSAPAMTPPPGHPDHGVRVLAWYFWLFPTTMINVYPWGISANAVQPLGPARTRVRFTTWTWERPGTPGWAALESEVARIHQTELEDEAVVERVQRGVHARAYAGGRYAQDHEAGVHHFHALLAATARGATPAAASRRDTARE